MSRCRAERWRRRLSKAARSISRFRPRLRTGRRSGCAASAFPTRRAASRATCTPRSACGCRCRWTSALASGRQSSRLASLLPHLDDRPVATPAAAARLRVRHGVAGRRVRLLAPYFGTSLYVWGVLIGLILLYLSAGYVIGGRLADRHPRDDVLYQITAWAGLWIGVIPLVSYPILLASQQGFKEVSVGLVAGTLFAVVILFAVPVILLGCVSPFAIRLLLRDVESGGNTAGRVYALSTAGSILGTFLPVFWFIPSYGTRPTLEGFGLVLVGVSIAGLWPRRRLYASFAAAVILAWIFLPSGIKPPQVGQLLYEKESAYGYIQVVHEGSKTELILNEGEAIHSIYDPSSLLTGGPWDYMLVADSFRPAQASEPVPKDVAILGLAGGTAARQYTAAYGSGV